jgi:hypothetical protein
MVAGHWGQAARYGLPGVAVGLALAWFGGGFGPMARAQGPAGPGGDANGTIAFASPTVSPSGLPSQMLYLIDTKAQSFAVYRVDPQNPKGTGAVKLEASRQYRWDLKLSEYNNSPPEVSAVESMVTPKTR